MGRDTANDIERRRFLVTLAAAGVPLALPTALSAGRIEATSPTTTPPDATADFPRNDPSRVQAVVGASHSNMDRVRTLVLEQPALAKASVDWGFGDWESALGAASHTGRREIAEFLIGHGARPTLFSAAMLGQVDTVRAHLTADPSLVRLAGPHGISLHRHARAGGTDAQSVLDYLSETFGPDDAPFGFEADEASASRYAGRYRFETDPVTTITVGIGGMDASYLLVGAGEQPNSRVLPVEPDVFHPTGAPAVRLEFEVSDGRTRRLRIVDGPVRLTGERVAD